MLRVLEISDQVVPVVTPALDGNRIVLALLDFKFVKCLLDSILWIVDMRVSSPA